MPSGDEADSHDSGRERTRPRRGRPPRPTETDSAIDDRLNLERNQAACIGLALIQTHGQQNTAAALLGISPRVLNHMLKAYELQPLIDIGRLAATTDRDTATESLNDFMASYRRGGAR